MKLLSCLHKNYVHTNGFHATKLDTSSYESLIQGYIFKTKTFINSGTPYSFLDIVSTVRRIKLEIYIVCIQI